MTHSKRNTTLPFASQARLALTFALLLPACNQTYHPVVVAPRAALTTSSAQPSTGTALSDWAGFLRLLHEPGPIVLEKHVAADWEIPLGGLLNLDHPKAQAAGLKDHPEPIQVYFYILEHPRFGGFMVDSGIARSVALRQENMPVEWPVSAAMPMDSLQVHLDTQTYLSARSTALQGVWLTHLHLDHILGLQDLPKQTPLFIGPGETDDHRLTHLVSRSTTDANLAGFGPLQQWSVQQMDDAPFAFVDIFGDQSVLGLHVPGHTQGNMAFVVRTTTGPQLLTGDACHTDWGWQNGVEPGSFNTDGAQAANSLHHLKQLAAAYPEMTIHLGHQPALPPTTAP